ncbi:MAG: nucleotidyltransferase family protein [Oscillospiraceae bacterium]|nr:nucleotidyltransferase family protein [Oscillospiraceae bacterium]
MISLIKSAIKQTPITLPDNFDWNEAIRIAERHHIIPLIYLGAHISGIELPTREIRQLKTGTYKATILDENQKNELSILFQTFSHSGIDYMPLKGIVLKQLYPSPEMREMSDADILIRLEQYTEIAKIMLKLGYHEVVESDHELIWSQPPFMTIELHKRLIPSYNKDYYAVFGDGWQLARRSDIDWHRYEMLPEDQLVYLFTHFAKHYRDGGIGIKHFVDLLLYMDTNLGLNMEYVKAELTKLQLYEFFQNVHNTIDVWFNDTDSNEMSDFITKRLFASGAYGADDEKTVAASVKRLKAMGSASHVQRRNILDLIFLPYPSMCVKYPILRRIPFILPVFWIIRAVQTALFKPDNIRKRRDKIRIASKENINRYHDELVYVGLDFNFKE